MATKQGKKPAGKIKNLPAKPLTAGQAKRVKGGGGIAISKKTFGKI